MKVLGIILSLVLAGGIYAGSSVPVFSADNGTVEASVTVQDAACIVVTSSGIDYGTRAFSTAVLVQPTGSITSLASCSGAAQSIQIKGAAATGPTPSWSLVSSLSCPGTTNQFVHEFDNPNTAGTWIALTTGNLNFGGIGPMVTIPDISTRLTMPCTGSAGAGMEVTTQIIFTATVS
jgi:hypothetical protein